MSRKYKKQKGITTGVIIGLVGMALVGALGALSKGFKDWNYKDWFNRTSETKEEMSRPIEVGDNLYNAVIELHLDDALKKFGEVTSSNQNTKLITFNTSFEQAFGFKENGGHSKFIFEIRNEGAYLPYCVYLTKSHPSFSDSSLISNNKIVTIDISSKTKTTEGGGSSITLTSEDLVVETIDPEYSEFFRIIE